MQEDPDAHIRLAAFSRLDALTRLHGSSLPWQSISEGFTVGATKVLFATAVEGIFKPKQMSGILSIKTVVPKPGGKIWYADQVRDEQIASPDSVIQYSFKGTDPEDFKNLGLREAMLKRFPLIYFYGVKPGSYLPLYPVYIVDWNPKTLSCSVGFDSEQMQSVLESDPYQIERSYTMVQAKHRIHQSLFRERVIEAYNGRCALTGLPSLKLVDAAHIIPDRNEDLGQPDIRNGICMTKIHHAAFDSNLIGIDPDYRIHVAESLLSLHDGPMLEQGLKALQGKTISLPKIKKLWPDRDRLDHRFKEFIRNT
jgi:putative restriction endonuclease